jgi:hypothetical protein
MAEASRGDGMEVVHNLKRKARDFLIFSLVTH